MVLAVLPDNEFPESRFIKGGIGKRRRGKEEGAVGKEEEEGRRKGRTGVRLRGGDRKKTGGGKDGRGGETFRF